MNKQTSTTLLKTTVNKKLDRRHIFLPEEFGKKVRYKGLGYFRKDKQTYCIQDGRIFRCVPIPPKNQGRHEYIELDCEEIEALNLNVEKPPKQTLKKKKPKNTSENPTPDKESEDSQNQTRKQQTKKKRPLKIHDPNQQHTIQGSKVDENGKKVRYKGLGYFRKDKQTYCIQDDKIFRCVPIPPKNQGRHEYIELEFQEIEALDLNGTRMNSKVPEKVSKVSNQNDEDENTQDKEKGNTGLSQAHLDERSKPRSYAEVLERVI